MNRAKTLALILTTACLGATAASAVEPISTKGRDRVAVERYDAVSYFDGQALEGDPSISHRWQGAIWFFASTENRDRFVANPESYAPQYGGYCAFAVSKGYTADVDPEAWTVVDGKLYLNNSKSVRTKWRKDIPGNIAKADRNWPGLLAD